MGFHKRYISDEQIIDIYRSNGCQAVIDWFTKGVDVVIISGELAYEVNDLMNILQVDKTRGFNRISETIAAASIEKDYQN